MPKEFARRGAAPPDPDPLSAYRRKRSPGATPEPAGGSAAEGSPGAIGRPARFVVQQHAARRLHWDLRLEMGGVLRSWAVPKGPSLDPAEKRLAVETEPHPMEYADFEGVIPDGNYGAGAMIVWDRGAWVPHLDPDEGMETGKQLFDLQGYKLRGLWTLVRTKRSGETEPSREWLLIKKPDPYATGEDAEALGAESVLSGLTVEELASGGERAARLHAELDELGAPRRAVVLDRVRPMLAETAPAPFSRPGWLFELKYDGYRLLAATGDAAGERAAQGVRMIYRSGRDATAAFPDLARALAALPFDSVVLDGEVAVLDEESRPSFQRLQRRALLSRRPDVERAAVELPAVFFVFDLLAFEGRDLRPLPLAERKRLLAHALPAAGPVRFADHVEERGEELYAAVRERGLEGLLAKQADSPYRAGRSPAWLKVRADRTAELAVVGMTAPEGSRGGFGALHLAWRDGGRWVYAGRVGSGFSEADLATLSGRLEAALRDPPGEPPPDLEPAPGGEVPRGGEHAWVEPSLVVEVRYKEVTEVGQLRQPVFLRVREDRRPEDCLLEGGAGVEHPEEPDEAAPDVPAETRDERGAPAARRPADRGRLRLTNLEKVFWPEEGYSKGDLIAYYRAVAPAILPFLRDRPVVLDRYPDGVTGKSFFQKNAADFTPAWVRTEEIHGDDGEATRYFVCDDEEALLYLANLGTVPLHVVSSRIGSLERPDWAILDLDAKDAPFAAAVEVARAAHRLCDEIELPSHVKTSGASGLHVLVPTGGRLTHDQARQLAELLARVVAAELPEIASVARLPGARRGKVYLDFLQNGWGKLLVSPYCVRPLPGAPVSAPLRWSEVGPRLSPKRFTIESMPRRLARQRRDPLAPILSARPDLASALARLAEKV